MTTNNHSHAPRSPRFEEDLTLLSSGEKTDEEEPAPATVRMPPRPLAAQITAQALAAPPPQISVMTPSQPFLPMVPTPPPPAATAPSIDVRRVEHVIVNAASGWLQFALGIMVAISFVTAAYLVFEAWHPRGIRIVSTHTPITIAARAASTPTRGRAPAKPHVRTTRPAAKDGAPATTAPAEEVNPSTILDDGLVALL